MWVGSDQNSPKWLTKTMQRIVPLSEASLNPDFSQSVASPVALKSADENPAAGIAKRRSGGLTAAERQCFRRFPVPTSCCAAKFEKSMSEPVLRPADLMAHVHAAADAQLNRPIIRRKTRRASQLDVMAFTGPLSRLDAQEESCKRIIKNIYPSTLTGMDKVKEMLLARTAQNKSPKRQFCRRPSNSTAGDSSPRSCSGSPPPGMRASSPWDGISLRSSVCRPREKLSDEIQNDMWLIRNRAPWDMGNCPMVRTAIRLVQGASVSAIERRLGGEIVLVGGDPEAIAAGPKVPTEKDRRLALNVKVPGDRKSKGVEPENFSSLRRFRGKLLKRFNSIQAAFNAIDVDDQSGLSKREWSAVLNESDLCTPADARLFYDFIDADKDGLLTMSEFRNGIESIAQVTSMEALRRRIVCLGFKSVLQAISVMNGKPEDDDTTMFPIGFSEFSTALRRAWIVEPREHRALFDAVRDQCDASEVVTLSELAMGVAASSPALLLDEFRELLESGGIDLAAACERIAPAGRSVDVNEFEARASTFDVESAAAHKTFRLIDVDRAGGLKASQILAALKLSTAALPLEEFRLQVLQSYRSIEKALRDAYNEFEDKVFYNSMRFEVDELLDNLSSLKFNSKDVHRLGSLMGASKTEGITLAEFMRGLKFFAPSYLLHDIRMQLLQTHESVNDAFIHVGAQERREPMGMTAFRSILKSVQVECEDVEFERVYDLLDIRCSGKVTLTEVMAALKCVQVGKAKWVAPAERDKCAKGCVKQDLAPYAKRLTDLRSRVKVGLSDELEQADNSVPVVAQAALSPKAARAQREKAAKQVRVMAVAGSVSKCDQVSAPPKETWTSQESGMRRVKSLPNGMMGATAGDMRALKTVAMRRTFQKVTSTLEALGPDRSPEAIESVGNYFNNKDELLKNQKQVLDQRYKRCAVQKRAMELRRLEEEAGSPLYARQPSSSLSSPTGAGCET